MGGTKLQTSDFAKSQHWKELVLGDEAIGLHFRLQVVPLLSSYGTAVHMLGGFMVGKL